MKNQNRISRRIINKFNQIKRLVPIYGSASPKVQKIKNELFKLLLSSKPSGEKWDIDSIPPLKSE